ncbi:hypothetical protein Y032_0442g1531 [Ancylostoma ceylanicum]|uniref:GIY-YIG domain-containing protein n=1 Tax=Ancylostoma ceylanicum TaxID=53326 RepID=A0A016WYV9_9BILA|nr:hypothetical protein Y032_0442g1531 [Ancylostoma ceylanicum]
MKVNMSRNFMLTKKRTCSEKSEEVEESHLRGYTNKNVVEAHSTYCTECKICQLRGTVYMLTCEGCGEKYVGETARPLHARIDEHLRALRNPASYQKKKQFLASLNFTPHERR